MRPRSLLYAVRRFAAAAVLVTLLSSAAPAHAAAALVTFRIAGGGWGHGIGMSQYGARGFALQGKDYSWILAHYYKGTTLVAKPTSKVRVNLDAKAAGRAQWRIQSGSDSTLTVEQVGGEDRVIRLPWRPSVSYWIVTTSGNTAVHVDESYYETVTAGGVTTKQLRHRPAAVPLMSFIGECYAHSNAFVKMVGTSGPYSHEGVVWRGTIHFKPSASTASASKAINYVDLEQYLYGVVPRESPSSWPAEALKAQAVAARSYAYGDALANRTIYCTTASQVYNGYRGPKGGESASTNAAVNATAHKVLASASGSVVKAYFCSSTGGRTASIQDVWLSSSPVAHFSSVEDADQASPHYKWTVSPTATSAISSKLRAKVGSSLSAPSPATIEGMRLDRAPSGYTRYVTVHWSNGSTYRVSGDTVRSALGLKSTKFSVTTRVEEKHKAVKTTGTWTNRSASTSSQGTHRTAKAKGASITLKFKGTSVAWIGSKHTNSGKADVYLDGVKVAIVDGYASKAAHQQVMYARSGLKSGTHTIKIRVRGTKRAASKGTYVRVDAFDLKGTPLR